MIELKALNLHWLENIKPEEDLCAHGSVFLKIGEKIVSDEKADDLTVCASAYHLLKTLSENHNKDSENQLIPHCGTIWEIDDKKELIILNCSFGINWTITHKPNKVVHEFESEEIIETDFDEWRNAVCNFSDEVMRFYEFSLPKIFEEDEDKIAFELFMREWKRLRTEAFD